MLKTPVDTTNGPGTTVGVNVALSGTLKDQNDITVYGMVDGEIVSEKAVTIGETAQVKGPIRGQNITVAGVVRGSIDAAQRLEILATGKVYGSITTKDLVVHSGAILAGKSMMAGEENFAEETPEAASGETERSAEAPAESGETTDLPQPEDE